jgi:hypothetical protein
MTINLTALSTKTNLKTVDNPLLKKQLADLIEENQSQLSGEYDLYTIYRKDDKETYALIYAEYYEKYGITYDNSKSVAEKDAQHIHELIKGLDLDYLFVVPYYNYADKSKGAVTIGAVVTNEI